MHTRALDAPLVVAVGSRVARWLMVTPYAARQVSGAVARQLGVKGYPTVMWLQLMDEGVTVAEHSGGRDAESLVAFAKAAPGMIEEGLAAQKAKEGGAAVEGAAAAEGGAAAGSKMSQSKVGKSKVAAAAAAAAAPAEAAPAPAAEAESAAAESKVSGSKLAASGVEKAAAPAEAEAKAEAPAAAAKECATGS